jgi:hypothetical protein
MLKIVDHGRFLLDRHYDIELGAGYDREPGTRFASSFDLFSCFVIIGHVRAISSQ